MSSNYSKKGTNVEVKANFFRGYKLCIDTDTEMITNNTLTFILNARYSKSDLFRGIGALDISTRGKPMDLSIMDFTKWKNLQALSLSAKNIKKLKKINDIDGLESLDIHTHTPIDLSEIDFAKLKNLKEISLYECFDFWRNMDALATSQSLQTMNMKNISYEALEKLKSIKFPESLKSLNIYAPKFGFENRKLGCISKELDGSNIKPINLPELEEVLGELPPSISLTINGIKIPIIANNVEGLMKAVSSNDTDTKEIIYTGTEKISSQLFQTMAKSGINLTVQTPTVFDSKTCEELAQEQHTVSILNDRIQKYDFSDICEIGHKINKLLADAPRDGSDLEKILYIYKKITETLKYDYDALEYDLDTGCKNPNYSEENLIKAQSLSAIRSNDILAICHGYALLLNTMATELGLDCQMVGGYVKFKEYGHTWNQVKIDGKWYNLDVTADSGKPIKDWKYFLCSDENFPDRFPLQTDFGEIAIGGKEKCGTDYDRSIIERIGNGNTDIIKPTNANFIDELKNGNGEVRMRNIVDAINGLRGDVKSKDLGKKEGMSYGD